MNRIGTLFLLSVLLIVTAGAQTYPVYTIRQIQEIPDSVLNLPSPNTDSPRLGDTAWVRGVVATAPRLPTGQAQWFTGDRWRFILKDPSQSIFNHITVVAVDTLFFRDSVGLDLLAQGDSVEILGKITEFRQLTQFEPLKIRNGMNLLGTSSHVIAPVTRPVSDFFTGTTIKYNPAEKYESGFIRIENVTVLSVNNFEFTVADASGNQFIIDDQSTLINPGRPGSTRPPAGAKIDWVQGYIFTNSSLAWTLNPRDTSDYQVGVFAPSISQVTRGTRFPGPSNAIPYTARILDQDGSITSAVGYYAVNGVPTGSSAMTAGPDSVWSVTIPAIGLDSAFVTAYIVATDNSGNKSVSPTDTTKERHFFFVLNRAPRIAEVQYNPYGGGSSYVGDTVTVTGIATSDRRDFGAIFIQEPGTRWSGIRVNSSQDTAVRRGQNITARGVVAEAFSQTVLNSATLTINSSGNPVPAPVVVSTANVRTGGSEAEAYESVLIQLNNVYVVNINEDSPSNSDFGEFGISENVNQTTGLRVDDYSLNLPYTNNVNRSGQAGKIQLRVGDRFASMRGVLFYSFSQFKLVPRDSADFSGYQATTSVEQVGTDVPSAYRLAQNYPNPFNPTTTIEYAIGQQEHVTLNVYNVLGQKVGQLVNDVMPAGTYRVQVGTDFFRSLSSGMYFYTVTAGSFTSTKKMVLIR